MKVVVAGVTGTLGTELVPRLLAAGHTVVGLTRGKPVPDGVERVVADIMDGEGLLAALDGVRADAVMHQATAITRAPLRHKDLFPTDALRDVGTRNLLRAASQVGATRFVTQSFFLGYGWNDHGPTPVTEDRPPRITACLPDGHGESDLMRLKCKVRDGDGDCIPVPDPL